jgi:hypothetical protein
VAEIGEILDVMIGIQDHGDDFCSPKAKISAVVISRMLDNFRFLHVRAEISGLPIVILEKCQDIMQSDSRNENGTLPIVKRVAGNLGVRAGGNNPSQDNLSSLQLGESGVSGGWLQVINPQEIASAETLAATRVSFAYISVK